MADESDEVQRSLGRIEGAQIQILAELKSLREDFGDHKDEDREQFGQLKQDADRAKGAGWAILTLLGALATFVGGAVLAVLQGWIKFHH